MVANIHKLLILLFVLALPGPSFSVPGAGVVYPDWFKQSFNDLKSDLQDARDAGKKGILVFFSMKTCSYCQAMIETAFREEDIVKRLRKNYDVLGLDVFSDNELVDTRGKIHWTKDFAISEKAKFTPTLIFYGQGGSVQLRLVGYQSAKKMRVVLDYLEGNVYTRMSLRDFMQQGQTAVKPVGKNTVNLVFDQGKSRDKHLMVVFESIDCSKCRLLRTMLNADLMQPYLKRLDVVFINNSDEQSLITTPQGKKLSGKAWADQLGLIHSPAMVFFYGQGNEVLRVDTDILINRHGKVIKPDDKHVLDNIRARLQFVVEKGYVSLPQFQRWRAQQKKNEM